MHWFGLNRSPIERLVIVKHPPCELSHGRIKEIGQQRGKIHSGTHHEKQNDQDDNRYGQTDESNHAGLFDVQVGTAVNLTTRFRHIVRGSNVLGTVLWLGGFIVCVFTHEDFPRII